MKDSVEKLRVERDRYKRALENHLCDYDLADWLGCAGHSERKMCILCDEDAGKVPVAICSHESAMIATELKENAEARVSMTESALQNAVRRAQIAELALRVQIEYSNDLAKNFGLKGFETYEELLKEAEAEYDAKEKQG